MCSTLHRTFRVRAAPTAEDALTFRPLLSTTTRDGQLELAAAGSWTARHAKELELLVEGVTREEASSRAGAIDMRGVKEWRALLDSLLSGLVSSQGRNRRRSRPLISRKALAA